MGSFRHYALREIGVVESNPNGQPEIGKQEPAAARRERSSTQVRVQSTNANLGHPPMDSRHYAKVRKGECKSRRLAEHTPVNRRQCLLYSSLQFQRELLSLA
jgi:hypothetical protein